MKTIVGAALGSCVHVGGLHNFLQLAEKVGYKTHSLGPAVSITRIVHVIEKERPDLVAISYRLTPEVSKLLFEELSRKLLELPSLTTRLIFGGPPPVAAMALRSGLFEKVFDGSESVTEITSFLKGMSVAQESEAHAHDLIGRIQQKYPYPIIRHHFGRPSMEETANGIRIISLSEVLDVISLGTDQLAQEYFFRQDELPASGKGAGGVPVRSIADMELLYKNSRYGNFPLMRCYAGTRDLLKWAEMSVATIHNAWGAIPLCWYSVVDGRSDRSIRDAITENQMVMKWYAEHGIPVEVNESHQWSLRDAHDSLAVAMAYLAAYNAKKAGVKHYVAQFMFNTPPGTWPDMDIAKMQAKLEMMKGLEDKNFQIFREVRAGIAHFSPMTDIAKGQLASSALISLSLKPHIIHVVSFSEGDHATHAEEVIESCNIVHGVLRNCLHGMPDMTQDSRVLQRKSELVEEANEILKAVQESGINSDDPFTDPSVIARAIQTGILDAPHFRGNKHLKGNITTRVINGAWYAIDPETGCRIKENRRIKNIFNQLKTKSQKN